MSRLEKLNKPFRTIGRLMYAIPFLGFGINHFIKTQKYVDSIPEFLPFPEVFVYAAGVAFILAAISMVINVKAKLATILLVVLLLIFIAVLYAPNYMNSKTYIATYSIFIGGALLLFTTAKD